MSGRSIWKYIGSIRGCSEYLDGLLGFQKVYSSVRFPKGPKCSTMEKRERVGLESSTNGARSTHSKIRYFRLSPTPPPSTSILTSLKVIFVSSSIYIFAHMSNNVIFAPPLSPSPLERWRNWRTSALDTITFDAYCEQPPKPNFSCPVNYSLNAINDWTH